MTKGKSLRQAIDNAVRAIQESKEQIETIANSTMAEVERLEAQYEHLKADCLNAITMVEDLERMLRAAREQLMIVNRGIGTYTEQDMRTAYERADGLQGELGQWREREAQLRFRRDDVARRLKALRATAHEAEILLVKFRLMTDTLGQEFADVSGVLEVAKTQVLLGIRMLQIQEDERRQLSHRLHDGAMQSLASVAMRVQSAQVDSIAFRQNIRESINSVISDLRQLVFDLRPPLLDDLGLVPTLKRYIEQWAKQQGVRVRTQLIGLESTLSPTEKVTVFRTVQEGLRNIAEHAHAHEVSLHLIYSPDKLEVQLLDDGLGIEKVDWEAFVESGRMGLVLCRERLGAIGGTLDFKGASQGTKLVVAIPTGRGV